MKTSKTHLDFRCAEYDGRRMFKSRAQWKESVMITRRAVDGVAKQAVSMTFVELFTNIGKEIEQTKRGFEGFGQFCEDLAKYLVKESDKLPVISEE